MSEPHALHTPSALDALTSSHRYVLVDFTAEWCPPCKAIAPFFAQLARKHGVSGKLAFAKVDVDEMQETAKAFGITAMPSFLVLVDGKAEGVLVQGERVGLVRGANPKALTALGEALSVLAKEGEGGEGGEGGLKLDEDF